MGSLYFSVLLTVEQYGNVFSFTMVGKTFTYLIGAESSALFFNSKNENLNAEEVYSKLITPVFGKGVAYDVPNNVSGEGSAGPANGYHAIKPAQQTNIDPNSCYAISPL